jgi:hypothetical protein
MLKFLPLDKLIVQFRAAWSGTHSSKKNKAVVVMMLVLGK